MSQTEQIIRHLEDYGSITPHEALREYGIMRLAARVLNAKEQGADIHTELVCERNRYGEAVRYARYWMAKPAA